MLVPTGLRRHDGVWQGVRLDQAALVALPGGGIRGEGTLLPGQHDLDVCVQDTDIKWYFMKYHAPGADLSRLDCQIAVLDHLAKVAPDLSLSRQMRQMRQMRQDGSALTPCAGDQARLLTLLDGQVLGAIGLKRQ